MVRRMEQVRPLFQLSLARRYPPPVEAVMATATTTTKAAAAAAAIQLTE